jgi:hypothetical protein
MDERKTIPQRMDDMVRWTGVPALSQGKFRRRPFRWLSTLSVVGSFAGFVTSAAGHFLGRPFAIGYMVLVAGFLLAIVVQVLGPLKPFNSFAERADEFDRNLRARAYLSAFPVFALTTMLGLGFLMWMVLMAWPAAALMNSLSEMIFVLVSIACAVPALYASWAVEWNKGDE